MFKTKNSSIFKQTKANKKWMEVNKDKVKILENLGLRIDEIKVISRYIGSCGHDKKLHCPTCGEVYSTKQCKMIRQHGSDFLKCPEIIYIEQVVECVMETMMDKIDPPKIKMEIIKEENKDRMVVIEEELNEDDITFLERYSDF